LSTLILYYLITIHLQLLILFYTIETSIFYYLNTAIVNWFNFIAHRLEFYFALTFCVVTPYAICLTFLYYWYTIIVLHSHFILLRFHLMIF